MTCHFQSFGMGLFYCCLKRSLIHEHISLERGAALARPEVDKGFRLCGSAEFMHAWKDAAFPFQIRCSHIHCWPKDLPLIDVPFEIQVGVGLHAPGCTNGRGTACKVKLWESERQLLNVQVAKVGCVCCIKHVFVQ